MVVERPSRRGLRTFTLTLQTGQRVVVDGGRVTAVLEGPGTTVFVEGMPPLLVAESSEDVLRLWEMARD